MSDRNTNGGDEIMTQRGDSNWDGLVVALEDETRRLREFHGALLLQRAAVATNDPEAVQLQTDEIARLLRELEVARARRRTLMGERNGGSSVPLTQMESLFGARLPAALEQARTELLGAARSTAQQLSINHSVLRRALESGEAFLKAVFTHLGPETSSYRDHPAASQGSGPSVLVNKVA